MELKRAEEIGMMDRAGIAESPGERPGSEAVDLERLDPKEVLRSKRWYWIGRRVQDIFFSSLALLVLWPVIAVFALAVEVDSPGASPFFVQERIGRKGKPFKFINLRCMENIGGIDEIIEQIRACFCTIQTIDFRSTCFRQQIDGFLVVMAG